MGEFRTMRLNRKSTLINALCRMEVAEVGNVPTTRTVQTVPWEGYTLIDTPGINAQTEHTATAEQAIRESDMILFVMDNSDTFDSALVYQAIAQILEQGKALAIVLNQKSIDESEDVNTPVPELPSMRKIQQKVLSNLQRQVGGKLTRYKNFLSCFCVNAKEAFEANEYNDADRELMERSAGILSLRTAINDTMKRSAHVYQLQTPMIQLNELLQTALKAYRDAGQYGDKQQLAEAREQLSISRQRLRDMLLVSGSRKIDVAMERIKSAIAEGRAVETGSQELERELTLLLEQATNTESSYLNRTLNLESISSKSFSQPERSETAEEEKPELADFSDSLLNISGLFSKSGIENAFASSAINAASSTIPVPGPDTLPIVIELVIKLVDLFSKKKKEEEAARQEARRSQEMLEEYYRRINQVRDYETEIKQTWETRINDILRQTYDAKLEQLDAELAKVNRDCAKHTENLQKLESLQQRVADEILSLGRTIV